MNPSYPNKQVSRPTTDHFVTLLVIMSLGLFLTGYAQKNKRLASQPSSSNRQNVAEATNSSARDSTGYRLATLRKTSVAPSLLTLTEPGREGMFRLDESDRNSPDNGGTVLVTKSGKRYKRVVDNEVNVRWFGAVGNGTTDDSKAVQNTINYAKTLFAKAGGTYRVTIVFPAGFYYLTKSLDVSNANGLWLKGSSGRYINTGFIGDTGGTILDFSGSTMSGCEGFTFLSMRGNASRSTVGVLFALTAKGGLNCSVRNSYFKLDDNPAANSGFGSIGILNIRSEEFSVSDCVINANTPIILSNKADLSNTGVPLTINSPYATILNGAGSMGVVNLGGQLSLHAIEKRQPALVLNGTNTVQFVGYIGRSSQAAGTEETAILCSQSTSNLTVNATIESYSQVLRVKTSLHQATLTIVSANAADATRPLVDVTGASLLDGLTLKLHLPVAAERQNRYLMYHAPLGNGNDPVQTRLMNTVLHCSELTNNQYVATGNLLKLAENVTFNTSQPFAKIGGVVRQHFSQTVSCGTAGNVKPATAIRFRRCDRVTTTKGNGGFYSINLEGVIRAGSHGSGGSCTQRFTATITVSQSQNGNQDAPAYSVSLVGKSQLTPAYLDITKVAVSVQFEDGIGSVSIKPSLSGTAVNEPVTYQGTATIMTDFMVNDTALFK